MNVLKELCVEKDCDTCPLEGCIEAQRALRFFEQSNLDRPYWTFVKPKLLTEDDRAAFKRLVTIEQNMVQWVANAQNVLIHSQINGNGKSTWGRRLLVSYFKNSLDRNRLNAGVHISFFEFLDRQRDDMDGWDEEFQLLKKRLITADLVVWDDFATAPLSDFSMASIGNIIDTRINRKLSNVYTTNFDPNSSEFKKRIGLRVWDRVYKLSECIEFVGEGQRGYGNATNLI